MSLDYARDLWIRSLNALKSSEALLAVSSDDAASRAYYAVFHAVSAAFAIKDQTFIRHSALRSAVHREWVKPGVWTIELGADFDSIWELRDLGDYGGGQHVEPEDARAAFDAACKIIDTVRSQFPEMENS
jgi:uncharacterized protein (UPF0332 family)